MKTDLLIKQGTSWKIRWPISDSESNDPTNFTGYSARSQIRPKKESSVVLHEWSTDTGSIDLQDGFLTLIVAPSVSTAWEWLTGVYDIEITNPAGEKTRPIEGNVTLSREVTR